MSYEMFTCPDADFPDELCDGIWLHAFMHAMRLEDGKGGWITMSRPKPHAMEAYDVWTSIAEEQSLFDPLRGAHTAAWAAIELVYAAGVCMQSPMRDIGEACSASSRYPLFTNYANGDLVEFHPIIFAAALFMARLIEQEEFLAKVEMVRLLESTPKAVSQPQGGRL